MITISTAVPIATLFIVAAKWYHDHMTLKDIKSQEEKRECRLGDLEKELLKIVEALDRTYATEDFVYRGFIHEKLHKQNMEALEEKMLGEMKLIRQSIESLVKTIEGK